MAAVGFAVWRWMPGSDRLSAFVAGLIVAFGAMAVREVLISATGTMARRSGIDGEMWTASELRRLRRAGWLVLNGLPLPFGDVDHIAIGPGWVLALETKRSSQPWDLEGRDERIVDAAAQARHGANRVSTLLRTLGLPTPVRGVVVLWGAVASDLAAVPHVDTAGERVAIVHGSNLQSFLREIKHRPGVDQQKVWNALASEIERRDAYEAKRNPEPIRLQSRAVRLAVGMGIGLLFVVALFSAATQVLGTEGNTVVATLALGLVTFSGVSMWASRRYPPALADVAVGIALSLAPFLALLGFVAIQLIV